MGSHKAHKEAQRIPVLGSFLKIAVFIFCSEEAVTNAENVFFVNLCVLCVTHYAGHPNRKLPCFPVSYFPKRLYIPKLKYD